MHNIGLIGAGQLGSRHLQGLLKLSGDNCIYILDPSENALNIATERAKEIQHTHQLFYCTDWKLLPASLDLVIVATGANVREKVVTHLLVNYKVNYLILEKVLFQDMAAYQNISDLLEKYHVTAWVNHPRRMYPYYQHIKKQIESDNSFMVFSAIGSNWGLGCNGLHFIDLFAYLGDTEVADLDTDWIDNSVLESKRAGYMEFTGSVKGRMINGATFQITSFKGDPGPITISIACLNNRWIIQEGGTPQIIHLKGSNQFAMQTIPIEMEFQSSLTTRLANNLFEQGTCDLPTYKEAQQTHKKFIDKLLKKYVLLSGIDTKACPIT